MIDHDDWKPIAWHLWRYRLHTWMEISRFLASEGWAVHPVRIEAYCMAEAYRRLNRFEAGPSNPPGRRGGRGPVSA